MEIQALSIEVLEGCRASTGLSYVDFSCIFGLAQGAVGLGRSGGILLEVSAKDSTPVRVYAIAKDGKFLIGLRRDFEKFGLRWGRMCDALDKTKDKRVTG